VTPFTVHPSGAPTGLPVVFLHGFLSDHRMWAALIAARPGLRALAVDLPGHGDAADRRSDWPTLTAALAEWIGTLSAAPLLVGYSLGGRVLRQLLLGHEVAHSGAVLISTHAGFLPAEGAARRRADEDLAQAVERRGIEAFVSHWEGLPVFAGQPPCEQQRSLRLAQDPAGLASSLHSFGSGTCSSGGSARGGAPITLIHGDRLPADTAQAQRLAADWPSARLHRLPGIGHNPVLECPQRIADLIAPAQQARWTALADSG
jgi:2-succinyl-6-hydroxy-2,4-cyclohexadiene-1-carboxylate synthase